MMMCGKRIVFLTLLAVFCWITCDAKPATPLRPEWMTCKRNIPNFDECLVKSLNSAYEVLLPGARNMRIPPLSPLKIPAVKLRQKSNGVDFSMDLTDLTILGLPGKIISAKANLTDFNTVVIQWSEHVDTFVLTGKYNMKGTILRLPLGGQGKAKVALANLRVNHTLAGKGNSRGIHKFLNISQYVINIEPEDVHLQLDGLMGGNKELGLAVNRALNENWRAAYQEIRTAIDDAFAEVTHEYARRVFGKIPLDLLFPK